MAENQESRIAHALKNGTGTIITRLAIMAMPPLFAGSVWIGKVAIELGFEKITAAIERVEHHVDKIDGTLSENTQAVINLDKRVTRNEDHIQEIRRKR